MLAGLFFFEGAGRNVFSGRGVDLALWHDVVRAFGGDTLLWVDWHGHGMRPRHDDEVVQRGFRSLDDALRAYPGIPVVCLHPSGTMPLWEFRHPPGDAIYLVGPDGSNFAPPAAAQVVSIPVARGEIWAEQALAIGLADRHQRLR